MWLKHSSFVEFVEEKWRGYSVSGWGIFVFKEKLKLLKDDIKVWSTEKFGNIERSISELNLKFNELDQAQEERALTELDS